MAAELRFCIHEPHTRGGTVHPRQAGKRGDLWPGNTYSQRLDSFSTLLPNLHVNRNRPLLLVENDPNEAFFFKREVDALGRFEVFLVSDGRAAIRFLECAREVGPLPGALFVDLTPARAGGKELLAWLCDHPDFAGIVRFALDDPAAPEAMPDQPLRVRQVLAKPVTAASLKAALTPP